MWSSPTFDALPAIVAEQPLAIGVIATPAPATQGVADLLVGVGGPLDPNFAPKVLTLGPDILLRYVDLSHRATDHELLPVASVPGRR